MTEESWTTNQIQVDVSGFFTTHHTFQTGMGSLGELTLPAFRSGGVFHTVEGQELTVQRTSWWRGEYEMHKGSTLRATAHSRGFFRRDILIWFEGQEYVLERLGFLNRGWRLVGPGRVLLLEVHPRGIFRQGAFLEIREEIDVDLLVFVYYLVHTRWQEETAAATTAAAAS